MMTFLNNYINSGETTIAPGQVDGLFSFLLYFSIFIIFLATIIILVLMIVKKKPYFYYIYNIVALISTIALYVFSYSNFTRLEVTTLDVRTLKINSDLLLIITGLQGIMAIIALVRATGFNIKKFNFEADKAELEITEKDNEEFEVSYEADTNEWKRRFNKNIRNLKYFYKENKLFINIGIGIFVTILVGFLVINYFLNHRTYKLNTTFSTGTYNIRIVDSYLTQTNFKNRKINEGKSYVVTKVSVNRYSPSETKINTAAIPLTIDDHNFYPTIITNSFDDLGTVYQNEALTNELQKYLLVYEIPEDFEKEKMILTVVTDNKNYRTRLKPTKVDADPKVTQYKLKDKVDLSASILKNTNFQINSFEIQDNFKLEYAYKVSDQETITSYEYLAPSFTGNQEKALLKIEANFELDETSTLSMDFADFVMKFGTITYQKGEEKKTMNLTIKEITPNKAKKKNIYYFEVLKDVKDADKITLQFNIRSQEYQYILK